MTAIDSGDLDRLDGFEGEDYQRIHVLQKYLASPVRYRFIGFRASARGRRWDFCHW